MTFIEKRLLNIGVGIPKTYQPRNEQDRLLWPSYTYMDMQLNNKHITSLNMPNLANSLDYVPDFSLKEDRQIRRNTRKINSNAKRAVKTGFLIEQEGFILIRRVNALDIEKFSLLQLVDYEYLSSTDSDFVKYVYDYDALSAEKHASFLHNAYMDFPFAKAFINDADKLLIEPLVASIFSLKKIFSIEHPIFGVYEAYLIHLPQHITLINNALIEINKNRPQSYPLYCIYDGISSFEAGRLHWEHVKNTSKEPIPYLHPARFCMLDISNLTSDDCDIRPINYLIDSDISDFFIDNLRKTNKIKVESFDNAKDLLSSVETRHNRYGSMCYGLLTKENYRLVTIRDAGTDLGLLNIQEHMQTLKTDNVRIQALSDLYRITDSLNDTNSVLVLPPINKTSLISNLVKFGPFNDDVFVIDDNFGKNFIYLSRLMS